MKNLILIGFSPEEITRLKPVLDKFKRDGFELHERENIFESTIRSSDRLPNLVLVKTSSDRDYEELLREAADGPCGPLLFLSSCPHWQELRMILGYFTDSLLPIAWDYLPIQSPEAILAALETLEKKS